MKAFIVAALLVAAVAGQSLDLLKLKEKSLLNKFNRPLMERELLLKKLGYPVDKTIFYGDNLEQIPFNYNINKYTTYEDADLLVDNEKVLRIDELLVHPLFHEYLNLPLFRQFWQYTTFQKYVTSSYFQRFWQIPAFKQYFYNPVLFYKYVYPIVTLFKSEFTTIPTTFGYGDELIKGDEIVNKNLFPLVTGYERDLLKDKFFVPTIYNHDLKLKDDLLAKALLVKIYSHLYEIPEELVKEHLFTVGKNFFPITKDIMTTMMNKKYTTTTTTYPFETTFKTFNNFEDKLVKDELVKKILLNKMIVGDEVIDKTVLPEDFLLREKMMTKMNPIVARMMYGMTNKMMNKLPIFDQTRFETIDNVDKIFDINMKKDLIKDELLKKELIKNEILKNEILKKELLKEKIFNNVFEDKEYETIPKVVDFTTPMMKVKTFDKIIPETIIKA